MKSTMKTICLGRFLVDVPNNASYIGGTFKYRWNRIDIEKVATQSEFLNLISGLEERLRTTKHNSDPSLLKTTVKNPVGNAVTLAYWKYPYSTIGYEVESYIWRNQKLFAFKGEASRDRLQTALDLANRTLSEFRPRHSNKIPAEPGFCIDSAYFAGEPSQPHDEFARVRFGLKDHPDVWIEIYTDMNGDKMDDGLLARVKAQKPLPTDLQEIAKKLRSIRMGKHAVNGIDGEEILEAYPANGDGYSHVFRWEALGKPRSIKEPSIVVEIQTATAEGGGLLKGSSLTDKQAIELFDSIVNTIRLRPTTPGKNSDAAPNPNTPPRLAIGTQVSSLRACPETGLYECPADAPGVEERRVFIEQGRPMPGAFASQMKRGIAGILGGKESKEVEVRWTLVSYEKVT